MIKKIFEHIFHNENKNIEINTSLIFQLSTIILSTIESELKIKTIDNSSTTTTHAHTTVRVSISSLYTIRHLYIIQSILFNRS